MTKRKPKSKRKPMPKPTVRHKDKRITWSKASERLHRYLVKHGLYE
jgi:tRNA G46 methylase TrmB